MAVALLEEDDGRAAAAVEADGLDPRARLAIYRHHVLTTLTSVLEGAYPAVCHLVDPRFFAYAADQFIRRHPPEGPCLAEYGARFPGFLADFGPARRLEYLPDVARLEWALHGAAHAPDAPAFDASTLRALAPEAIAALRVRFHPSVTLLSSRWPVDRIWQATRRDADPGLVVDLDAGGVCLQIQRDGDDVGFRRLDGGSWTFRRALAGGRSLEEAAGAALTVDPVLDLTGACAALFDAEIITEVA